MPIIHVVDYDPGWPGRAAEAIGELERVLPGVPTEIEHIGSTAVPGLAAKPIIDLMAAVADLQIVAGDYARAKTDLIRELTDRARAEQGLPSIPVWERGSAPLTVLRSADYCAVRGYHPAPQGRTGSCGPCCSA